MFLKLIRIVHFFSPSSSHNFFPRFCFSDVTFVAHRAVGWRHGLQVIAASTSTLFFLGMFYRSASLYHPQRRAILHLKDMSKKKGKDKNKIENKPPYFDFATLKLRSLQVSHSQDW